MSPQHMSRTYLNRACQRVRQACIELHKYREDFPEEVRVQRDSMFCEDFQSLAAYDAADTVLHLLQFARRQINQIKAMKNTPGGK